MRCSRYQNKGIFGSYSLHETRKRETRVFSRSFLPSPPLPHLTFPSLPFPAPAFTLGQGTRDVGSRAQPRLAPRRQAAVASRRRPPSSRTRGRESQPPGTNHRTVAHGFVATSFFSSLFFSSNNVARNAAFGGIQRTGAFARGGGAVSRDVATAAGVRPRGPPLQDIVARYVTVTVTMTMTVTVTMTTTMTMTITMTMTVTVRYHQTRGVCDG